MKNDYSRMIRILEQTYAKGDHENNEIGFNL